VWDLRNLLALFDGKKLRSVHGGSLLLHEVHTKFYENLSGKFLARTDAWVNRYDDNMTVSFLMNNTK